MKNLISIFLTLITTFLFAQEKTFVREYSYQASEIDSKISSRAIATNQVRLIILNEIGVYVESESLLKTTDIKGKFNQDFIETISTISAGITKLVILDEKWDGKTYWMKASITIDKKELEESLKQLVSDRQRVKELEDLRRELGKAREELIALSNELQVNKGEKERYIIGEKYNKEIKILNASEFIYSGRSKLNQDYIGAIADFTEAIKIDPSNANTFYSRGLAKFSIQDYNGAIDDYTSAIEIEPNNPLFYFYRGTAKGVALDHVGAIDDCTKAIKIDPDYYDAFLVRGLSKAVLKNYTEAIIDYNQAIKLNNTNAEAYLCRGSSKAKLLDYRGAIDDFNTALKIDPKNSEAFGYRGVIKHRLEDYKGAIIDLTKTIEIDPANSLAYYNRGLSRIRINQFDKGCQDLSKAGELGYIEAYELIKKYCN